MDFLEVEVAVLEQRTELLSKPGDLTMPALLVSKPGSSGNVVPVVIVERILCVSRRVAIGGSVLSSVDSVLEIACFLLL